MDWLLGMPLWSKKRTQDHPQGFHTLAPHEETTRHGSPMVFKILRAAGREVILPKLQFNVFKRRLDLHTSFLNHCRKFIVNGFLNIKNFQKGKIYYTEFPCLINYMQV